MKKLGISLLIFGLILNKFVFAFIIPDGSGGFFGDVYSNPQYYYLNPDLNAIIQEVLEGYATPTPPEEGVPVFPYDPILYFLLIRGFGLDTAMQQKLNQNLLKIQAEGGFKEFSKNFKDSLNYYQTISLQKAFSEVADISDTNNLGIAKWLNEGSRKTQIIDTLDNLQVYFSCRDLDFDGLNRNFVQTISGFSQLGTYARIKYDELSFCQTSPSFAKTGGTNLAKSKPGILSQLISAFMGKFYIAQVNENIPTSTEEVPSITIRSAYDYIYRDLQNAFSLSNLRDKISSAYINSGSVILNQYVRINKCIIDDDGNIFPDFRHLSPIAYDLKLQNLPQANPLSVFKTKTDFDENIGFLNAVAKTFIKDEDFNIYSFNNGDEILNYIYNQCKGQATSYSQFRALDKANNYSDCVKGYIRNFINMLNLVIKVLKTEGSRIEFLRSQILAPIYDKVNAPEVQISGALKDKLGLLNSIYYEKYTEVNNLNPIDLRDFQKISCGNMDIFQCYGPFFNNNFYPNLKSVKEIIGGPRIYGGDYPFSVSAFTHYLLTYALKANDLYNCYKDKNQKISNYSAYRSLAKAKYKVLKIKKQIAVSKNNFNLLNFISQIFKPKEINLTFEK